MPDTTSHTVIMALGCNHEEAEAAIAKAIQLMSHYITDMHCTETLMTEPIGIQSGPFCNCIIKGLTILDAPTLMAAIKQVERECGDRRSLRQKNIIMMDIDLLLHGTKKYHPQDWKRDYIQQLLSQTCIPHPPSP
ncbi:MAG: 2-amino-4-hydroxy-6-hydroxymethyldihydropteridine diphosphokinase [Prevotella sp.]|nr:2-amino-4-hydroxy-6-hydroxymethyldihydropteridine diphosphokinase [Prevotella sp.]